MRTRNLTLVVAAATAAVLLTPPTAGAAPTPEQQCQKGRYDAAAKYAQCELKGIGKSLAGGTTLQLQKALSNCRVKYQATWAKLQAKASGTGVTCDDVRYVDNADGTVTDNLTRLVWEQKVNKDIVPNPGDPHDSDNTYSWSAGFTTASGTAFTDFLDALNFGAFAGQSDWRLPTRAELQTILSEPYPCTSSPCIDEVSFGPTRGDYYWSSTTIVGVPGEAWVVYFGNDVENVITASKNEGNFCRAVRGGL